MILVQDRELSWTLLNIVVSLRVPRNTNYLTKTRAHTHTHTHTQRQYTYSETPLMRKYGENKTTRVMMATVPHVTA